MMNFNDMFALGCHLDMNGFFYDCCVCGAVVSKDATTLHHEWHEKQALIADWVRESLLPQPRPTRIMSRFLLDNSYPKP